MQTTTDYERASASLSIGLRVRLLVFHCMPEGSTNILSRDDLHPSRSPVPRESHWQRVGKNRGPLLVSSTLHRLIDEQLIANVDDDGVSQMAPFGAGRPELKPRSSSRGVSTS